MLLIYIFFIFGILVLLLQRLKARKFSLTQCSILALTRQAGGENETKKTTYVWFIALLIVMSPIVVVASPVTYYNLDFEDGSFGGGYKFASIGEVSNISSINLDGRALFFGLGAQLLWKRNDIDSTTHYVAFDYYAESGANLTDFLDIPQILRLDTNATGRHHIDIYYNLSTQRGWSYLDGILDESLLTIMAWNASPSSKNIRIGNQIAPPGNSKGVFEIDNLVWMGNVSNPVPESVTMLLFASGLAGLLGTRIRKKE